MVEPVLQVRNINKAFGATQALRGVSLDVLPSSVHALVGENGAGKSTLGKILAGLLRPDSGSIRIAGEPVTFRNVHAALTHGIAFVSQEIALVPGMSVIENVFLGRDTGRRGLSRTEQRHAYERLCSETGLSVDPRASAGNLNIAQQQKVEILRAIARQARVIVLDEPTAALSTDDRAELRRTVRGLATSGSSVIYISHHLDEVLASATEVSVLRNGELVDSYPAESVSERELIEAMTGAAQDVLFPPVSAPGGKTLPNASSRVELAGVETSRLKNITVAVPGGEILGVAGLLGSGRSQLARVLGGAARVTNGQMLVGGVARTIRSPSDARRAGIAYLPESRKAQGLIPNENVLWNVMLPYLGSFRRGGLLRVRAMRKIAAGALSAVAADPALLDSPIGSLSGGNQQKVLLARCIAMAPAVLVVDEPTRGIDIGAKRSIYQFLAKYRSQGAAVLMVSSEIDEILGISDRVVVMRNGAVAAEFEHGVSQQQILHAAFGRAQ